MERQPKSPIVGSHVACLRDGQRYIGMVAYVEDEDGTVDIILNDGTEMDQLPVAQLVPVSAQELLDCIAAARLEREGGVAYSDCIDTPAHALRFVCISDTHGRHREAKVPEGDVLLHAGDFTNTGEPDQVQDFHDWLVAQPHRWKILIAGNHDITFDPGYYLEKGAARFHSGMGPIDPHQVRRIFVESECESLIYLEDSAFEIPCEGRPITVWGSPYQPEFCDWAFNLGPDRTLLKAQEIPTDTDVLLTHGPPHGHGDITSTGTRVGCCDLLHEVQTRIRPVVHCFGHIHSGYGVTSDGSTTFCNASTVTEKYQPSNVPLVFDIAVDEEGNLKPPVFQRQLQA